MCVCMCVYLMSMGKEGNAEDMFNNITPFLILAYYRIFSEKVGATGLVLSRLHSVYSSSARCYFT